MKIFSEFLINWQTITFSKYVLYALLFFLSFAIHIYIYIFRMVGYMS